jgi:hypothetical protein
MKEGEGRGGEGRRGEERRGEERRGEERRETAQAFGNRHVEILCQFFILFYVFPP